MKITEPIDVWHRLQRETRPIVVYGTGNGADKLFFQFERYGISVSDIFVSDAFYRGQEFRGYTCLRYQDIKAKYDDCIIVLAFAVFRPDMMQIIEDIRKDYEVLAPEMPVFGEFFFTQESLDQYRSRIEETETLFADDLSRAVYQDLINYRMSGKLSYLDTCTTEREEVFQNIFSLHDHETYVDLGAYRGDTIEEFLSLTNSYFEKIYAVEPDAKNFRKLEEYLETLPPSIREKIFTFPVASWKEAAVLSFDGGGGRNSSLNTGKKSVHAVPVDSLLDSPVTYIKMDVEGADKETLLGLSETLKRDKPKLAVSAYHRTEDLFEIPQQILELNPNYSVYLRHHPYIPAWETNYYCK